MKAYTGKRNAGRFAAVILAVTMIASVIGCSPKNPVPAAQTGENSVTESRLVFEESIAETSGTAAVKHETSAAAEVNADALTAKERFVPNGKAESIGEESKAESSVTEPEAESSVEEPSDTRAENEPAEEETSVTEPEQPVEESVAETPSESPEPSEPEPIQTAESEPEPAPTAEEPSTTSYEEEPASVSYTTVTYENRHVVNRDRVAEWCSEWAPSGTTQYDTVWAAIYYAGLYCRYEYGLSMFWPTESGVYGGTCYDGSLFLEAVCDYKGIPCEVRYAANDYQDYGIDYGQGSDHYNCFVWIDGTKFCANCQPGFAFPGISLFVWDPEAWAAEAEEQNTEPEPEAETYTPAAEESVHTHVFSNVTEYIEPDPIEIIDKEAWTETIRYEVTYVCECGKVFATEDAYNAHVNGIAEEAAAKVYAEHFDNYDAELKQHICTCGYSTSNEEVWAIHRRDVDAMAHYDSHIEGHDSFEQTKTVLAAGENPAVGSLVEEIVEHPAETHLEYPEAYEEHWKVCALCGYAEKVE